MTSSPFHQDLQLLDALAQVRERKVVDVADGTALQARLTALAQEQDTSVSHQEIQEAVAFYQAQQINPARMTSAQTHVPEKSSKISPGRWRYQVNQDVLSGERQVVATLRSRQALWSVRPRLRLTLPLCPGHHAPIQLDAGGQWFDHLSRDHLRIRFDDHPVERWGVFEDPYERLTLHDACEFLARVKASHTLFVEVALYRPKRLRTASFEVTGLLTEDQIQSPPSFRDRWVRLTHLIPSQSR